VQSIASNVPPTQTQRKRKWGQNSVINALAVAFRVALSLPSNASRPPSEQPSNPRNSRLHPARRSTNGERSWKRVESRALPGSQSRISFSGLSDGPACTWHPASIAMAILGGGSRVAERQGPGQPRRPDRACPTFVAEPQVFAAPQVCLWEPQQKTDFRIRWGGATPVTSQWLGTVTFDSLIGAPPGCFSGWSSPRPSPQRLTSNAPIETGPAEDPTAGHLRRAGTVPIGT
jgi:hypothetical protein